MIPGYGPAGAFLAFHDFLAETYPRVHRALDREVVGGLSLLYTWRGTDRTAGPILLTAHQDVVPVSEETLEDWTHPPFAGAVAEGYIWGRGSMDCKGILIAILEAAEGLLARGWQPRRSILLAFGHDEEVGGHQGAARLAALLRSRGVQAEFVLDEGGFVVDASLLGLSRPVAAVGIAEKGYLSLSLSVEAEGGHSSMPPAHTAIGTLARAIQRLESSPFPARLERTGRLVFEHLRPELSLPLKAALAGSRLLEGPLKLLLQRFEATNALIRTTQAATIIQGGVRENVLPQHAAAVVNLRLLPGDSIAYAVDRVKKVVNDPRVTVEVRGRASEASPVSDLQAEGFRTLKRTIREVFPGALTAPLLLPGMSDARHYSGISTCMLRFGPQRVNREDRKRAHGTNERVSVENYREFVDFYARLLRNAQ